MFQKINALKDDKRLVIHTLLLLATFLAAGCSRFLDVKPDKRLVIPDRIAHLQGLLDYYRTVNLNDPTSLESSADNLYLPDETYQSIALDPRRRYTWQPDYVFGDFPNEWSIVWDAVFVANTVLDNLGEIGQTDENRSEWRNVKGQALLHRARSLASTAYVWALAYDEATADTDLGIPLRLDSDFNKRSVRSTLRETYEQIIQDLKASAALLPNEQITWLRPVKGAAYGFLARVYLNMGRFGDAERYADSALAVNNNLLDFNQLDSNTVWPIQGGNVEVIFESSASNNAIVDYSRAAIVPELIASYHPDDLRRTIYFVDRPNGTQGFRANYTGESRLFTGVATNELFLIRAECRARRGDVPGAMQDLNKLLHSRWRADTFFPYSAGSPKEALKIILHERRKELVYRGLRWMDIKRLNKEGYDISITRSVMGETYMLPANSPRFALPLPEKVMQVSGMQQNPQ